MTTATTRQPMTRFQKTVIGLLVALVAAVVVAIITIALLARNADIQQKKQACEVYPIGSADRFYCDDQAER